MNKKIAFLGVMGALAIAVTFLESLFNVPFLPPGAKPGLSNVITLSAYFFSGTSGAIYLSVVKALFALVTRGGIAFLLSLSGGIFSVAVMILFFKMKKCPFSVVGISVIGAICHNVAQVLVSIIVTKTVALIYYLPVLLVFSIISGTVTGVILKVIKPLFEKSREREL